MTNEITSNTPSVKERELWNVQTVFITRMPQQVTVTVAAFDADHAEELARKVLKNQEEVEVVNVYKMAEVREFQDQLTDEQVDGVLEGTLKLEQEDDDLVLAAEEVTEEKVVN